jgi:small subunit ribosomal protein S7
MPRKGFIAKREVAADPIYGSTLVTKFVNSMMWGGKKSTAQGIFYQAMTNLEAKGGDEALKLFKKAVENVSRDSLAGQLRPLARRKGHG